MWQMSGATEGYPSDGDPLKQAQLAYSLYMIDYGCLAPWRSKTPISNIRQFATIMEHHVFCREVWTGVGDHYLTMGLNWIGGLSAVTSACSAAAVDIGGGGNGGEDDSCAVSAIVDDHIISTEPPTMSTPHIHPRHPSLNVPLLTPHIHPRHRPECRVD